MIDSLFHSIDADVIYKISLTWVPSDDHIAWNHEKNGMLTVRSAYRLGINIKKLSRNRRILDGWFVN